MQQAFDMTEIIGLYKEDARKMVSTMQDDMSKWSEIESGGNARQDLRRLAHQLRGSGRTYGFSQVTRLCKAIENMMIRLEQKRVLADARLKASINLKIDRLSGIFRS